MLSEAFGDLSIADDCFSEKTEAKTEADINDPINYLPLDNSKCWFLNSQQGDNDKELLRMSADYKYFTKDFDVALKYYQKFLETSEHKASYKLSISDSIIRCGLKSTSVPRDFLVDLLHNYSLPLVTNFGEQLQFWNLSIKVYAGCGKYAKQYFRTSVLLCDAVDTAESWEYLAMAEVADMYNNFRLGCLTRSIYIITEQIKISHGFICERMRVKALNLQKILEQSYSESATKMAKDYVCFDLQGSSFQNMADADEQPVHNCKNLEKLKDADEQDSTIVNFIKKFSWLFDDKLSDIMSYI